MSPYLEVAQTKQAETAEAKALLDGQLSVPFMGLQHIEGLTQKVEKGLILEAGELIEYADFLRSSRLIRQFFQKNAFIAPILAGYTENLGDFSKVEQEIYQAIHQSRVHDQASRNLRKIRKRITQNKASIQIKRNLRSSLTIRVIKIRSKKLLLLKKTVGSLYQLKVPLSDLCPVSL